MAGLTTISSPPLSLLSYAHAGHGRDRISPKAPIRFLRSVASRLPTTTLSDTALDAVNLAGDLLAGGRQLREQQAYERWRLQRIKLLVLATDQVSHLACTQKTESPRLTHPMKGRKSRRVRTNHDRVGRFAGPQCLEGSPRVN